MERNKLPPFWFPSTDRYFIVAGSEQQQGGHQAVAAFGTAMRRPAEMWQARGTCDLGAKDQKVTSANSKPARKTANARNVEGSVGRSLRTAYEQAVNETVPPEMLDLLGRLN